MLRMPFTAQECSTGAGGASDGLADSAGAEDGVRPDGAAAAGDCGIEGGVLAAQRGVDKRGYCGLRKAREKQHVRLGF